VCSAGEERLRLKWFAYAATLSLVLLVVLLPVSDASTSGRLLFDMALVVGLGLALPLAVGIAVLKYRPYAIDKIISRTVSYALVTGLVVGIYLGCGALLTKISPFCGSVGDGGRGAGRSRVFSPLRALHDPRHRAELMEPRRVQPERFALAKSLRESGGEARSSRWSPGHQDGRIDTWRPHQAVRPAIWDSLSAAAILAIGHQTRSTLPR
jgi:hypothetical protein